MVEVVLEEESLRSDTRLPLESSPYMAGKIQGSTGSLPKLLFPQPTSPAILISYSSQYFDLQLGLFCTSDAIES